MDALQRILFILELMETIGSAVEEKEEYRRGLGCSLQFVEKITSKRNLSPLTPFNQYFPIFNKCTNPKQRSKRKIW
ncbi:hypothetical protein BHT95_03860 [Bacillus paralicheniformis]|nr:hypothetical protein BHT95_03860 [Bacillus paralicheniformis]TWM66427.1 hypothetical protein CHCC14814_3917 [Bacillus paralicheniformis]